MGGFIRELGLGALLIAAASGCTTQLVGEGRYVAKGGHYQTRHIQEPEHIMGMYKGNRITIPGRTRTETRWVTDYAFVPDEPKKKPQNSIDNIIEYPVSLEDIAADYAAGKTDFEGVDAKKMTEYFIAEMKKRKVYPENPMAQALATVSRGEKFAPELGVPVLGYVLFGNCDIDGKERGYAVWADRTGSKFDYIAPAANGYNPKSYSVSAEGQWSNSGVRITITLGGPFSSEGVDGCCLTSFSVDKGGVPLVPKTDYKTPVTHISEDTAKILRDAFSSKRVKPRWVSEYKKGLDGSEKEEEDK